MRLIELFPEDEALVDETMKNAIKRGLMKGVKAGLIGSAIAIGLGANYQAPQKTDASYGSKKSDKLNISTRYKKNDTEIDKRY